MDDLYDALANPYRRRLLVALTEHNPQDEIPATEVVHEGEKERERVKIEMVHIHLPKLEAMGLIEWNRETHKVSKGPRFDEIPPMLSEQ